MPQVKIPPGPKGHFLFGSLNEYARDSLGFMTRLAREYGDAVRFRMGRMPCYLFNHPDQIEEVVRSKAELFIKDRPLQISTSVFGQGLLTGEGDLWRQQRKLIQPTFLAQHVRGFAPIMVESANRMLSNWQDGQSRDVHNDFMRVTFDVVTRCLFGAGFGEEKAEEVVESVEVLSDHFLNPLFWSPFLRRLPFPSNLRFRRALRVLDEIALDLIHRGRAGELEPAPFLDRLLEAQRQGDSQLSDRQLRDEVVTLLLAGHETTALALSYTFFLLAQHPEAEARLAAELDQVLGGRAPTAEDLPQLPYLDWVIKESMRLYPPAWAQGREAIVDCEIGGYHIPKGAQVLTVQWVVHRDPRWFDEPEAFRPERWADDLERRLPRSAYFPFGGGPRICVGQRFALIETALVLATVAQRFRLSPVSDQPLDLVASITMRPRQGVRLRVQERERSSLSKSALGMGAGEAGPS